MKTLIRFNDGSALLGVLLIVAVLLGLAGAALLHVTNRRMTMSQTGNWQEALTVAEAGLHEGIAQIASGIKGYSGTNSLLLFNTATGIVSGGTGCSLILTHAVEVGGGQTSVTGTYSITGTTYGISSLASSGTQSQPYYRIRSTGKITIPGSRSLSSNPADAILRKLNLMGTTQTVSRTIEAWLKPKFQYVDAAIVTEELLSFNNKGIFVDSFDSTDPNRSLNGQPNSIAGYYNLPPYNVYRANIATNFTGQTQLGGAYIYGSVSTAQGGTIAGTSDIQPSPSNTSSNFHTDLETSSPPGWGGTPTAPLTVTTIDTTAGIQSDHLKRAYTAINGNITLSSTNTMGTYIDIYVSGDITLIGTQSIVIGQGVHATFYVGGDIKMTGNANFNTTANPSALNLSIIGVNPVSQSFTLAGNGTLDAMVYAPTAAITLVGGGGSGTFIGSITGKTVTANGGNVEVRYDEALSKMGKVLGFEIAAWFEDTLNNTSP